jgi:hypothetical protein
MIATLATNKNSEKQHHGPSHGIFSAPPKSSIIILKQFSISPWWGLASKI